MWQPPALPRTLAAALRDLDDPSPAVRASAVRDLSPYLDEDRFRVVAALRQALADAHAEPRAAAATVLGAARVEEAIDALIAAADDPHPLAMQMALEALGELADPRAVERLRRALRDPRPEARFQAVLALPRRLDDEGADQVLALACGDDDPGVRHIALRVAEERWNGTSLQPARVLRAAREALEDEDASTRTAAAVLLASRGDRAGAAVIGEVVEGRTRPRELEDEAAAVEAAGALGLRELTAALERRAYGVGRLLREQCSFHARVSLARLGQERARRDILRGLGAWTREGRNEAVLAAGKARLLEARAALTALRERPEQADPTLVQEALAALDAAG